MRKLGNLLIAFTFIVVSACDDGGGGLSTHSKAWDCVELSCEASFVIENLGDSTTNLTYMIKLGRSYDEDTKEAANIVVGEASGNVRLASREQRTVVRTILVSEEPNTMSAGVASAN